MQGWQSFCYSIAFPKIVCVCVCVCVCVLCMYVCMCVPLTSEGRVSSTRMLGPVLSGPKAQMDRAASKSQSYLVWKNSPIRFLGNNYQDRSNQTSRSALFPAKGSNPPPRLII